MAGTRQTNTFVEGLQGLLREVVDMQLLPDSDIEFLTEMQNMIIARAQDAFLGQESGQSIAAAASRGLPGQPGGGQEAAAIAALEGAPMDMEGGPPIPVDATAGSPPGVGALPPQVNPEQLDRIMQGTT